MHAVELRGREGTCSDAPWVSDGARARCGRLHNRMPVILRRPEDEALWLADRELSSKCAHVLACSPSPASQHAAAACVKAVEQGFWLLEALECMRGTQGGCMCPVVGELAVAFAGLQPAVPTQSSLGTYPPRCAGRSQTRPSPGSATAAHSWWHFWGARPVKAHRPSQAHAGHALPCFGIRGAGKHAGSWWRLRTPTMERTWSGTRWRPRWAGYSVRAPSAAPSSRSMTSPTSSSAQVPAARSLYPSHTLTIP